MVQVAEPADGEGEPELARIRRISAELSAAGAQNNALLELSELFS
jgi:hypothetical protein